MAADGREFGRGATLRAPVRLESAALSFRLTLRRERELAFCLRATAAARARSLHGARGRRASRAPLAGFGFRHRLSARGMRGSGGACVVGWFRSTAAAARAVGAPLSVAAALGLGGLGLSGRRRLASRAAPTLARRRQLGRPRLAAAASRELLGAPRPAHGAASAARALLRCRPRASRRLRAPLGTSITP